jgi:hypothetical protein
MAITLTVRDEAAAGEITQELAVEMPAERVTAREVFRSRVYQEVQDYNLKQTGDPFRGLLRPGVVEKTPNGHQPIDWKRQFERATEAFEAGQVLLLVDDRQVESLDEEVTLRQGSVATFLRLTLLVGG